MQHGWFWFDTKCVRLFKWNVQLHSVFFLQVYPSWTFIQICSSKYPSDESRIIVLNNRYIETFGGTCGSTSTNRLWWWSAFIWWNISTKGWVVTRETVTAKLVTLTVILVTCLRWPDVGDGNPSPTSKPCHQNFWSPTSKPRFWVFKLIIIKCFLMTLTIQAISLTIQYSLYCITIYVICIC